MVKLAPTLFMTVCGCVEARPVGQQRHIICIYTNAVIFEKPVETRLPISSEDSPRLITLGRDAMMSPCEDALEQDRLCREVRVLTGGSGPPLDSYKTTKDNTCLSRGTHREMHLGTGDKL